MLRRFYKSRLFWCGVPGLVFLLWVWWDSEMNQSAMVWNWGKHDGMAMVVRGVMICQDAGHKEREGSLASFSADRTVMLDMRSGKVRPRGFSFPDAYGWTDDEESYEKFGVRIRELNLALWVIVAGYVVVWLGAVWWWQRRKVRVMVRLTESKVEKEVVR